MKNIGETFSSELQEAGLLGLPFSWGGDGTIHFGDIMTSAQIDAVNSVYAAHDPNAISLSSQKRQAYKSEADLLWLEYQALLDAGHPDAEMRRLEWLTKRAEIKLRFE
jgi:hypothetical protein